MGGVAPIIFHDRPCADALAKLRHGVGRQGREMDHGKIERPVPRAAQADKLSHVHLDCHAKVGIGLGEKVCKMCPAGVLVHVNKMIGHCGSGIPFRWL